MSSIGAKRGVMSAKPDVILLEYAVMKWMYYMLVGGLRLLLTMESHLSP
jgi:hypothetical protein